MTTKYSKTIISRDIISKDDKGEITSTRKYSLKKLSTVELSREGFRLMSAVFPSAGVGLDSLNDEILDNSYVMSGMFQQISDNLTVEHYTELVDKLLGSLMFEGKVVEDWSEHFDEHQQDFLEILSWAGMENFRGFFVESTILRSLVQKIRGVVEPLLKTKIDAISKLSELDNNEKS